MGEYFVDTFFRPLGMGRTSVVRAKNTEDNISKGYMALADGTFKETERPHVGSDEIMFGATGVNSCIRDLLMFYAALLRAATDQISTGRTSTEGSPFRQLAEILSNQITTADLPTMNRSYGFGWHRSQLPNTIAASGMNTRYVEMPIIAEGSKSQLALYHGGNSAASQNWAIMLPESQSAIVVLTNTMANSDASNWIACLILETLLDSPKKNDFVALAEISSKQGVLRWRELHEIMARNRQLNTKPKPPTEYVGKYWNDFHNWHLDVYLDNGSLRIAFQGDRAHSHPITHYHHDVFSWLLTQDETAGHGRFPYTTPGAWLISFISDGVEIRGLRWNQHEIKDGEYFSKGEYGVSS